MKILIIKPSSFGDIIQANPTLTALKEAYPEASVTWLVFERWAGILSLFPDVDDTIVWDRKKGLGEYLRVLARIRKAYFDIVIDLQGLARTAFLARFSGARKIIGVPGMKEWSWLLVKESFPSSASLNAVHRSLETVRSLTGKAFEPVFRVVVPERFTAEAGDMLAECSLSEAHPLIGIVPSSRGRAKEWPFEHYKALMETVFSHFKNARILILGGSGDFYGMSRDGVCDLCGKTSLEQLAALMKRCAVIVGGDTGPVHLASSLGVPVVALFGGSDVRETAPIAANAAILKKDFPCSPCRGKPVCKEYDCLKAIAPHEVFDAMQKFLVR